MPALISKGPQAKRRRDVVLLFGEGLQDAREEMFVVMVCDGLPLRLAFSRAGFTSKAHDAPSNLFHLPRVQERARAILEARRTTAAVTLPQVTDMLQRVFANAHSEGEYSAAHNAAFSLARLYGHVTDKSTLEVIRRPSRDPDAPSEQALSSWVEALPALPGPGLGLGEASFLRVSDAPAAPLGLEPNFSNDINVLPDQGPRPEGPGPQGPDWLSDINGLAGGTPAPGRPGNGAPSTAVTEAPHTRAHSGLLGTTPGEEKRGPPQELTGTGYPKFEDLF